MRTIYVILIILVMAIATNAQVAVIANKSIKMDQISKSELLDCYTGDMPKWGDGEKVIVFDLKAKTEIKDIFYKYLGKSSSRMKSIWMKRMLSGDGEPPPALDSEEEMLKNVEKTKGAIGFISHDKVNSKVKILVIIEED